MKVNSNIMTNTFQILEGDTDILMIGKDTFTIQRFKELVVEKTRYSLIHKNGTIPNISSLLWGNTINIIENSVLFDLKSIELIFPPEGRECKILKLGSSEWQTGKIRIHVHVIVTRYSYKSDPSPEVKLIKLEFCYNEPLQQESLLDDIRQREDYQQLLNNQ